MESNVIVQRPDIKYCDTNKTSKKIQNTKQKDKTNNSRQVHRIRKPASRSNTETDDSRDDDVILRMVLPGYNWFEEQVKNNVYNSDGEKRIISSSVSTNPKLKIPEPAPIITEPLSSESADTMTKQKSLFTKRVINSTLMLLPNNSLPLKKRKIKAEMEETDSDVKEALKPQTDDIKKICNPPIQKVTPILNCSNAIFDTHPSYAQKDSTVQSLFHTSAFKNDHLQKRYPTNSLQSYNIYPPTQNRLVQSNILQSCPHYIPLIRKNPAFTIPDIRPRYQAPCCYQCNMFRFQAPPQVSKMPSQDCLKSNYSTYQPDRSMLPQNVYYPHNYYGSLSSYDNLVMPENRSTFTQSHQSPKTFENMNKYPMTSAIYHSDQMTSNNFNINSNALYPDIYWGQSQVPSYKQIGIESMCSDYNNSNLLDPVNVMPMMMQQFQKGYHYIG